MSQRKRVASHLVVDFETFGPTVVKNFDRLSEEYFRQFEFAHWHAVLIAASDKLKSERPKRREVVERLEKIKKIALSAMRKKTRKAFAKRVPSSPAMRRMFVECE